MKGNGRSKLNGRLTITERTAAVLTAAIRGDDVEQHRLNATAPRQTARPMHHFQQFQAAWKLTALFRLEQLQLTADLWHAQTRMAWAELDCEAGEAAARNATLWQATLDVSPFRLVLNAKAWDIVCQQLDVPAEFVNRFDNCIAGDVTEANLAANVPPPESVCESLSALGQSVDADDLPTVEDVAKQWFQLFDDLGGSVGGVSQTTFQDRKGHMNGNGMARLYPSLTVKERTTALVRGDDVEQQRLKATAPRRTERRWHHLDRVRAAWTVAANVRVLQLQTLADLWHAQARLAWLIDDADDAVNDDLAGEVRLWRAFVDVCCWRLSANQAAWLIVCERLGIAPEFLDEFGDCVTLRLTEARLADNTPTPDTVRERVAEFGEVGELTTAESIARQWIGTFEDLGGVR